MRKLLGVIITMFYIAGCATNSHDKEIPVHALSVGMGKQDVIGKLGNPHRVVSTEVVSGVTQQVWMYQQDKVIWLTGNAFLGGQTRSDRVIYLLGFADDKLIGWRDNAFQSNTKPENTFEFRNR